MAFERRCLAPHSKAPSHAKQRVWGMSLELAENALQAEVVKGVVAAMRLLINQTTLYGLRGKRTLASCMRDSAPRKGVHLHTTVRSDIPAVWRWRQGETVREGQHQEHHGEAALGTSDNISQNRR